MQLEITSTQLHRLHKCAKALNLVTEMEVIDYALDLIEHNNLEIEAIEQAVQELNNGQIHKYGEFISDFKLANEIN